MCFPRRSGCWCFSLLPPGGAMAMVDTAAAAGLVIRDEVDEEGTLHRQPLLSNDGRKRGTKWQRYTFTLYSSYLSSISTHTHTHTHTHPLISLEWMDEWVYEQCFIRVSESVYVGVCDFLYLRATGKVLLECTPTPRKWMGRNGSAIRSGS